MRKQVTTVRCDGNGCTHYADVGSTSETPDGWYVVQHPEPGKAGAKFDLCSLKCVSAWAKARREALGETNGVHRTPCEFCGEMISPQGMRRHVEVHERETAGVEA